MSFLTQTNVFRDDITFYFILPKKLNITFYTVFYYLPFCNVIIFKSFCQTILYWLDENVTYRAIKLNDSGFSIKDKNI